MRKLMLTIIAIIAMVTFITAFDKAVELNAAEERQLSQDTSSEDIEFYEN